MTFSNFYVIWYSFRIFVLPFYRFKVFVLNVIFYCIKWYVSWDWYGIAPTTLWGAFQVKRYLKLRSTVETVRVVTTGQNSYSSTAILWNNCAHCDASTRFCMMVGNHMFFKNGYGGKLSISKMATKIQDGRHIWEKLIILFRLIV